jgi:hypothetical protein
MCDLIALSVLPFVRDTMAVADCRYAAKGARGVFAAVAGCDDGGRMTAWWIVR